jgi:hypothetical protein
MCSGWAVSVRQLLQGPLSRQPFLPSESVPRFRCRFSHILNCYRRSQTIIHYFNPRRIHNICPSSTKHPTPPPRSGSCAEADRRLSLLLAKSLPSCDENQNYTNWEFFATSCCLDWKLNILLFFHIQRPHIFASTLSNCR